MSQRGRSDIADFLAMFAQVAMITTMLDVEASVMILRRFPWIAELHWQITLRLHELRDQEERLTQAREILLGERKRAQLRELEPPRRPVAPSERITEAGRSFSRMLELAR